ncbi:MAG: DUF2958 domain-containing protein [Methylomonas sp.]|nr:DUF2958 domain-containing protein [Methylomonas sp.]
MKLLTQEIMDKLVANGTRQAPVKGTPQEIDFQPVVKLFTPDAGCTWLLTEIDPDNPDIAFGLCDLGFGFPELGYVSLTEIGELRGLAGLPVERDRFFKANKTLSQYADEARKAEQIVA